MAEIITEKAYAKINLTLDVLGRLPNGYHEVKMVMQTIGIADTFTFEALPEGEITLKGNVPGLSDGEDNLIYRAAKAFLEKTGIKSGVRITYEKQIPMAAGMAGGSSDAAATLRGLNRLFGCDLSEEALCEIGTPLGADIPFCVAGGTQLSEGIGERLTKLPAPPELILAVAKPEEQVSTKLVYEEIDAKPYAHPDTEGMLRAIREGDIPGIAASLGNALEAATIPLCPKVEKIKEIFRERGALGTLMSGSGPTVFAIFEDETKARAAVEAVREENLASSTESFITRTVQPNA